MALTVGTAGHVDHGKTRLVAALTGKDTDRLPEEQRRGISIDLGYAPLRLADGLEVSLVDVPGHERFVRAMVAGATGIDLFLLVIDAAEGARPQTHEHLSILRILGIEHGVVAVTKIDAVDEELVELALEEAAELVPGAAVVPVSAVSGEGLDALRAALAVAAGVVTPKRVALPTRLAVDRAFTLHGIGTVATGTLWSGSVDVGDELRLEPSGLPVRVRSVQVHDRPVDRAAAGQRVAVALPGIERGQVRRGDMLVRAGTYPSSYRLDVVLQELASIEDGARLTLHHGTSRTAARVVRVGERFAQLRLAEPVVAARGDRVVLRAHTTVGGGLVLDPAPPRRPDRSRMELLETGEPQAIVRALVHAPVRLDRLAGRALLDGSELGEGLAAVEVVGDWAFAPEWLAALQDDVDRRLRARAEAAPLDPGLSLAELVPSEPWAQAVAPLLRLERREGKAFLPGTAASLGDRAAAAHALEDALRDAAPAAVRVDDHELARFLEQDGRLVRLGDGFAVAAEAFAVAREAVLAECGRSGEITLARLRDLLGVGRRDAQLLLERLDADGVTRRVGDRRVLRRRGNP